MKRKKFVIERHSRTDKSFSIKPPYNMEIDIRIDFDDVWHPKVNKEAKAIVNLLNNHLDKL